MIQISSRYRIASEVRNENTAIVAVRSAAITPSYSVYVTRDGDSFESLASQFLGAPVFYWKLADINPQVLFPDYIPVGTVLRIPQ